MFTRISLPLIITGSLLTWAGFEQRCGGKELCALLEMEGCWLTGGWHGRGEEGLEHPIRFSHVSPCGT